VITFSDITERKALEERIRRQAYFDTLTGLPNRALFHDRLKQCILKGERNREPFALLFVDLDRFKQINDRFGHEAGDQLLKEAAARLDDCVRESDSVARMGGDEFNIILSGVQEREALAQVAEKIIREMQRPFQVAGTKQRISASVGIACYPADGNNQADLLQRADMAMYRAKAEGRSAFWFYRDIPPDTDRPPQ